MPKHTGPGPQHKVVVKITRRAGSQPQIVRGPQAAQIICRTHIQLDPTQSLLHPASGMAVIVSPTPPALVPPHIQPTGQLIVHAHEGSRGALPPFLRAAQSPRGNPVQSTIVVHHSSSQSHPTQSSLALPKPPKAQPTIVKKAPPLPPPSAKKPVETKIVKRFK